MINKEEVLYNCNALVAAYLDKEKDFEKMYVKASCSDENVDDHLFDCTRDNCGEVMAKILTMENNPYDCVAVCVTNNKGTWKTLGTVDIIPKTEDNAAG